MKSLLYLERDCFTTVSMELFNLDLMITEKEFIASNAQNNRHENSE